MQRTIEFIIVSGWVLLIVVCLLLVGSVAVLVLTGHAVDQSLKELAGTAIGFLFGSVPAFLKDLLVRDKGTQP
jgi:hypothetical protein